jgi:hypothetical protein
VKLAPIIVVLISSTALASPPARDFTAEARALYAVAACGEAAPAAYDAAVVAAHCKDVAKTVALWRQNWRDKAAPFFAELHKGSYPATVVYPFGGGDLSTALVVFPDATEYTTLSLEGIGDPRPIAELVATKQPKLLAPRLAKLRAIIGPNLGWAWNTTDQLSIDSSETGAGLPGILTLALVALDANGYEPLEVRFFQLDPKGNPVYLTQPDVDAWDAAQAARGKPGKRKATNSVQQGAFNDVEIVFRKKGDAAAPKKTFRHLAGDLSNGGLEANGAPLAYLAQRREVAAMTKAASYLLWKEPFGKVRDYLLGHMKLMISDDTGIPPRYAKPAGFKQDVYGNFAGTFFTWADQTVAKEMVELWKGNTRAMPFRFGYYDNRRQPHLLYTYR